MLQLKNIVKDYPAGDGTVHALKDVSLDFRASEFVSILGPSGCGKTTLLNLVGGLDHYTSGDLVIDGRSTKSFKDRDWDAYRNHSIGFVFQSYNLIPHQSVLQNVELALTLSGVSKSERRKRAKEALERVGLGDQIKKKPAQMSGGQMQRVAIARAIVNNPEIILADEPTGALDTETSVQVMEILKEISKERLVIMVTHNPELAEQYSTRIIRMLDGKILSDTAPLSATEVAREQLKVKPQFEKKIKREKKPSMSIMTSFGLSLKNLFTKKGRTALTGFAGSIGIIGIALIYAVSQGMTTYINTVQEETLSAYPLTLEAQHTDMGSLMEMFVGSATSDEEHEKDAVYQKTMLYDLVNSLNSMESEENDLRSFKTYLESENAKSDEQSTLAEAISGIQYTYAPELLVYTENVDGEIIPSDSEQLITDLMMEYMNMDLSGMMEMQQSYGMDTMSVMSGTTLWQEMLPGENGTLINDMILNQYELIYGSYPNSYDEILLVVDEDNELDDLTLYALGLKSGEDIDAIFEAAVDKTELEVNAEHWSFEEICDMEFRVILNADCYTYDEMSGQYTDLRTTETGLKYLYDNAMSLKVTGILRLKEDATSAMLSGSIAYTHLLTEKVMESCKDSKAIEAQLADASTDIFTGLPFAENTGKLSEAEKREAFLEYAEQLNVRQKAKTYVSMMCIPSAEELEGMVSQAMTGQTRESMEQVMTSAFVEQTGMSEEEILSYTGSMTDEDIENYYRQMVEMQIKAQYAAEVTAQMSQMEDMQLAVVFDAALSQLSDEQFVTYYDEVLEFSDSTYEENLTKLGYVDPDDPETISIYASTFENKDVIEDAIIAYNESVDEYSQIAYTDYVGIMMSSITTIINAITYVLIAFVAVSLVVSSIMIGVITLISVQERTKEIGILRAIGASKKNVSRMFNAETVIIGLLSGALGVGITYLLCIPINAILYHLTGIGNLRAYLPISVAAVLVGISVLLTLFAGIIPSRSAAKKDPVVALRTE